LLYIAEPASVDFGDSQAVFTCGVGEKTQGYYLQTSEEVITLLEKISLPTKEAK